MGSTGRTGGLEGRKRLAGRLAEVDVGANEVVLTEGGSGGRLPGHGGRTVSGVQGLIQRGDVGPG